MAPKASPQKAAEIAIQSIGLGYDIVEDLRLKYCKGDSSGSRLIEFDEDGGRDVVLPDGILIPKVSKSIQCDKGERMRFRSDVLSFQRMSEQFNQDISLPCKIPFGLFNAMFEFSGCWQKDAANTKSLAFDGWFITLYTVALVKSQIVLRDHVKQAVPSSWDPAVLAEFIQKFGTHIVVGVKMGGKDVIYMKQRHTSSLQPAEVQKKLKEMADRRFLDANGHHGMDPEEESIKDMVDIREQRLRFVNSGPAMSHANREDLVIICKRRGGIDYPNKNLPHYHWLTTVQLEPDVISMSFVPITSLLNGVRGSGFLSHAINLYLRHKPPIEELHQFLEFQLPRQWAPVFSELPLGPQRKQKCNASLQFSLMGSKLYVNTNPGGVGKTVHPNRHFGLCELPVNQASCLRMVNVGKRPVTGLRLYLEGKRSNRLAIHLQHLSSLPKIFELYDDPAGKYFDGVSNDRKYYEAVQWKSFSHVCTAPVDRDEDLSIVTGAQLHVGGCGLKRILFLRLCFSSVSGARMVRKPEWEGPPNVTHKSGILSTLISTHFTSVQQRPPPRPADVNINSAVYPRGPPVSVQAPKLLKFVDMTEMTRGVQNSPGYWVVSGARLLVERGKISLRVKYSLLTVTQGDDEL